MTERLSLEEALRRALPLPPPDECPDWVQWSMPADEAKRYIIQCPLEPGVTIVERVRIFLRDDNTLDVELADGVSMTEAAKQFITEVRRLLCHTR